MENKYVSRALDFNLQTIKITFENSLAELKDPNCNPF